MNKAELKEYIQVNEPVFEYNGIQYSICCYDNKYGTWDEYGNKNDFDNFDDLLDKWIIQNKTFKEIVDILFG